MHSYLSSLDEHQRRIVDHVGGPIYVIAGPGAGKTHTLIGRVISLLERGICPKSIGIVTFSRKGASNLNDRMLRYNLKVLAQTFHGVASHLLRQTGMDFSVISQIHQRRIVTNLFTMHQKDIDISIDEFLLAISRYKISNQIESTKEALAHIINEYNDTLQELGMVDYDDLLIHLLRACKESSLSKFNQFEYLLIDEAQDMNLLQQEISLQVCRNPHGLFVIGDSEQSIYGFRASQKDFVSFYQKLLPSGKVYSLAINYRSGRSIVAVSNCLRQDKLQPFSHLRAQGSVHQVMLENEREEARYIITSIKRLTGSLDLQNTTDSTDTPSAFGDIAVLYRSRHISKTLIYQLSSQSIPYQIIGEDSIFLTPEGQFIYLCFLCMKEKSCSLLRAIATDITYGIIQPKYLQDAGDSITSCFEIISKHISTKEKGKFDLVAFLIRADGENPFDVLTKIIEVYKMGNGKNIQRIIEIASRHVRTLDEWLCCMKHIINADVEVVQSDKITISTIHSSKGLEFEHVFIMGCEEGVIPSAKAEDVDEERRLLYVALTRARSSCAMTLAKKRSGIDRQPSRFFNEIKSSHFALIIPQQSEKELRRIERCKDKKAQLNLFN